MKTPSSHTRRLSRLLATELLLGLFLLSACATPSAEDLAEAEYNKEDALLLAKEDYERRREQCENVRGIMTIPRYGSSSRKEHTASEYKMAQCQR